MNTKLMGKWGEAQAAEYLRKKGYRIISAGFSTRFGEIDLIAQYKSTVVFVEVKLRKNDAFAKAGEHVDYTKQQRIRTTAQIWLERRREEPECRFDVVEIYAPDGDKGEITINHIEDAF